MNFIIPKNYQFKPKLFGLIDYHSAIIDSVWAILLYFLVNFLFSSLSLKIYFFIGLFLPALIFSIIGVHSENIGNIIIYMFQFCIKQKIFLYKKEFCKEQKKTL